MSTNPAVKLSERPVYMPSEGFEVWEVLEHPFKVGDKVRIGSGTVVWTVDFVHEQGISMHKPKRGGISGGTHRSVAYGGLARIFHA